MNTWKWYESTDVLSISRDWAAAPVLLNASNNRQVTPLEFTHDGKENYQFMNFCASIMITQNVPRKKTEN